MQKNCEKYFLKIKAFNYFYYFILEIFIPNRTDTQIKLRCYYIWRLTNELQIFIFMYWINDFKFYLFDSK